MEFRLHRRRMIAINKFWSLAIAFFLAIVVPMQAGHCFDLLNLSEVKCCESTDVAPSSSADEESQASIHECCQPTVATILLLDVVIPLAFIDSMDSTDLSFAGGMVKEIDYPPQLS